MVDKLTAKGRNGQVTFDGKTVTITRDGFLARSTHGSGEKSLPIRQIAAVQFKSPSLMTAGFIQFSVPGETSNRKGKGARTFDAASDENSVLFLKKNEDDFRAVKDAIQSAIADLA